MYEYDFCEYAVEKKKEGAYLTKIIAVTVLFLAAAVLVFTVAIPLLGMSAGLICVVLLGVLAWYLSRFTAIEYEYTQTASVVDFAVVYSKQYRKEKLTVDVKKGVQRIAPYSESEFKVNKVYDFRSSSSLENGYMIIFDSDGEKCGVLFDATKRMVDNLRHQAPSVVTLSDGLPE